MDKLLIPDIGLFVVERNDYLFGNAIFDGKKIFHYSDDLKVELNIFANSPINIEINDKYEYVKEIAVRSSPLYEDYFKASFLFKINNSYTMKTEEKINSIKNFFNIFNSEIASNNKIIETQISDKFKSLSFEDYSSISQNFIKLLTSNKLFFLSREYYCGVESVISFYSYYCSFFVNSNEEIRRDTIEKINKDEPYSDVISYFFEEFKKFVKIIKKIFSLQTDFASPVAWLMLKRVAVEYFSNLWESEYGYILNTKLQYKTLDEAISDYVYCDLIEHDDEQTASLFTYYLMKKGLFSNDNFLSCTDIAFKYIIKAKKQIDIQNYEQLLLANSKTITKSITIDDIDLMSGNEFEEFVAKLFRKTGYSAKVTQHSGDQGIDVIAEKNGIKIGIQAKCYSGSVGNSAIQEVVAGRSHYGLDKVIVLTNSFFTKQAIELAASNNVILWDRKMLKEKI